MEIPIHRACTTIGSYAIAIKQAIDSRGYDGEALCQAAGIDLKRTADTNHRIPMENMTRLWELFIEASGDPAVGLEVGKFICPTSFHALSLAMWLCDTLSEGLRRFERYTRMFSSGAWSEFVEREHDYFFEVHLYTDEQEKPIACDAAVDGMLSSLLEMCRNRQLERFSPISIHLMRADTGSNAYESYFGCPVEFSSDNIRLYFDKQDLNKQLPTGNPELIQQNDHIILDYLARQDRDDILSQVQSKILELLPAGEPSRKEVAGKLCLSERKLQRKLHELGTSYKELLDEIRRGLALQYMKQSHLSQGEIGFLLGFATDSNFCRAFKRWTHLSPGDYRGKHLG